MGDTNRAASVKKRLMPLMDFLSGFEYSLTVEEVVKTLAKSQGQAARDEVVKLLETGLIRAESDEHFRDTSVRNIAISYAKAAQHLAQKKLIERALEINKRLEKASARATIYEEAAVAYAALGLQDEAKQCLGKENDEIKYIEDSWDLSEAEIDHIAANVIVGVNLSDSNLIEEGLKAVDSSEDRELALLCIVEALVDIAKSKNNPNITAKAAEVADRLEEPFDRNYKLEDRVCIFCQSDRREEAEALIERALSDAEAVDDSISRGSAYLTVAEAVLQTASPKD